MNIEKTLKLVGMALDTLGDKVVQREKEIYELKERIKVLEDTLSGVIDREYQSPIDREIHKNAAMHLRRKTLEVKP